MHARYFTIGDCIHSHSTRLRQYVITYIINVHPVNSSITIITDRKRGYNRYRRSTFEVDKLSISTSNTHYSMFNSYTFNHDIHMFNIQYSIRNVNIQHSIFIAIPRCKESPAQARLRLTATRDAQP